jgi:cytochrome c553
MKPVPQLVALSLLLGAWAAEAAEPTLARNLAATCANCHGTNGRSVSDPGNASGTGIESLAGRDKVRALEKLLGYKNGSREGTIMHQIAKGYTDEQLELIAGYFAAQPAEVRK